MRATASASNAIFHVIFILRGNGFVGSAFARYCRRKALDFAVISRKNYDTYRGRPCEILINCNGNSVKHLSDQDELGDFHASVQSVKASLLDFEYERYIHVSTGEVYPDASRPTTTREDQAFEIGEQTNYGFHKYLAEQCVRHSAPHWLIFRMGGFVGPGLGKNPIYDILSGSRLWVAKTSQLQYLDTDTTAHIVMSIADRGLSNDVFNLSGRGVVCLQDMIDDLDTIVTVDQAAPEVRAEISITKISEYCDLPQSSEVVRLFADRFADGELKLRSCGSA